MHLVQKSLPLVCIQEQTNKFKLTEEAAQFLCSLKRPVAVITIAGLYRTGKSFLVNKLIRNKERGQGQGFRVGSTTKSVTKGLNIWGNPITFTDEQGQVFDYLLIDSEGIGSCEQETKYDTNILILIFLISSTVIYNSLNAIDEMSLEQLQVVLKLKQCMQNRNFYSPPPKFIWVLRDFSLQLIDQKGKQMTPNQYLQRCLEQSVASNLQSKRKNQIRRAIKENLGEKSCYTLVRPTMKQQDLDKLNFHSKNGFSQPKIRTQFLGQIQQLKEEIFRGNSKDIKILNGQKITGKILYKILAQYIKIINEGELPNISNVWDSIVRDSNLEVFEMCTEKLKSELKKIDLPLYKDNLKMKINQIANRIYSELQSQLTRNDYTDSESVYKKYHKQFIKIVQKISSELKQKNQALKSNNVLSELRQFVKQNVQYDQISPVNVSSILKNLIERMKLKTNGSGQGYEYLLSVINDVLFIVEQKANKTERQLCEYRLIIEKQQGEKKHQDLVLINMKKQYHESLKTIAKLQQGQANIDKDYSLLKSKTLMLQKKTLEIEDESKRERDEAEKKIKQINQKMKNRSDELLQTVKKLREQNRQKSEEIEKLREIAERNIVNQKKQVIFSQKIQCSYENFAKQKAELLKKMNNYKEQIKNEQKKFQKLQNKYQQQQQKYNILKQQFNKKQLNSQKQLQNLKNCIRETKQSYELTFKTNKESEKVFKDIQNLTSAKKRNNDQSANGPTHTDKDRQIMKNYYQNQLLKQKEEYVEEIEHLEDKINKLQKQLEEKKGHKSFHFEEANQYKRKCLKLEADITEANHKFTNCLKEIQKAREDERILYENSILRLLNNIDHRNNNQRREQKNPLRK